MTTLKGILEAIIPPNIKRFISKKSNREKLLEKCGRKAFLMPDELKFPIMNPKCEYDCSLLFAAYLRAREWHYDDIAEKAANLFNKLNCAEKIGKGIRRD
jgi:hypothetical protein